MDSLSDDAHSNDNKQPNTDFIAITLRGSGIVTTWNCDSNQVTCPIVRCKWNSNLVRSSVHTHFQRKHAKKFIYCCVCERPVTVSCRNKFLDHYKHVHRTVLDPSKPKLKLQSLSHVVMILIRAAYAIKHRQLKRPRETESPKHRQNTTTWGKIDHFDFLSPHK